MARRRWGGLYGHGELPLTADVNLTNLIDVAFTLLIIFMITAPILQGGVEVRVPRAVAAPLTSEEAVIVSITADGKIFLDETEVQLDELRIALPAVARRKGSDAVYVKADERASYGAVLRVLGALKASEIQTVGLVAEPEPRRR
jgi:biopolymer transport protein ExbD/biopolymer transport protein TolR